MKTRLDQLRELLLEILDEAEAAERSGADATEPTPIEKPAKRSRKTKKETK